MVSDKTLIQSYVQNAFFVSTALRRSSAALAPDHWYYETLAWEWNPETKERGRIVESEGSHGRVSAFEEHARMCAWLVKELPEPQPDPQDEEVQ